MSNNFWEKLEFGQEGQDILIQFLEKHFGYKFEAGEIGGKIVNKDFIEELENCEVIVPQKGSVGGAKLRFVKNKKEILLTMPDVFMSRNSTDSFYWIEVKRHERYSNKFTINKSVFDDYVELYTNYSRQKFYVMCLTPENDMDLKFWEIYWCEMNSLIESRPDKPVKYGSNMVYVWDMRDVMSKLNKYPIDIYLYKPQ